MHNDQYQCTSTQIIVKIWMGVGAEWKLGEGLGRRVGEGVGQLKVEIKCPKYYQNYLNACRGGWR